MNAAFVELERVESTNNYATGLLHAGMARHGTAVFAHHQTAGRGQRGKRWEGEAGANVALSVVAAPDGLSLLQQPLLSMAVAVAVHGFVSGYAGEEVKIKWPNDIYWRDRKTAGILIENVVQGTEWKWAVVGIGLNVNQTDFGGLRSRAVSLKQITGKTFEPVTLAKALCGAVLKAVADYKTNAGRAVADYNNRLYGRNQTVRLKKETRVFEATVKGVLPTGRLVVQHAVEESFEVGEIAWEISGRDAAKD